MRVAAIPDPRFVEKEADYVLGGLSEIPPLIQNAATAN